MDGKMTREQDEGSWGSEAQLRKRSGRILMNLFARLASMDKQVEWGGTVASLLLESPMEHPWLLAASPPCPP